MAVFTMYQHRPSTKGHETSLGTELEIEILTEGWPLPGGGDNNYAEDG